MARNKRKATKRIDSAARFVRPTEQREAHNDFRSAGAAVRLVPVIETLLVAGKLTRAEFDALAYYREQAHKAEDDMAQGSTLSPERIMGGGGSNCGGGFPAVMLATPAIIMTGYIENNLGPLRSLARAIAVDDISPAQWAIAKTGGIERVEKGRTVIRPKDRHAPAIAVMELKYAAGTILR